MEALVTHRYTAEIQPEGGPPIETQDLAIDWIPALEGCLFEHVRRGTAGMTPQPFGQVQPIWDAHTGPPYVSGVHVSLPNVPNCEPEAIPLRYFSEAVRRAAGSLMASGSIEAGMRFTWRVRASDLDGAGSSAPGSTPFVVEAAPDPGPPIGAVMLERLIRRAQCHGATGTSDRPDFPVVIAREVIDEASQAATAAGELESGGVLLGRLSRDAGSGDLVLEVTAQVLATEALAETTALRFTPATWQAVAAAIRLRGDTRTICCGWWHAHPKHVWRCAGCPPERRERCPSNRAFFSEMDMHFHRTAFPTALSIALLLSFHEDPSPRHDLFGWRHGLIDARSYYVSEELE